MLEKAQDIVNDLPLKNQWSNEEDFSETAEISSRIRFSARYVLWSPHDGYELDW